jgi:hypothetical protein
MVTQFAQEGVQLHKTFVLLIALKLFSISLNAQVAAPRIIDAHVHYNGDPAFITKLVAKLESVDGMAFLLVKPENLQSAETSINKYKARLVGLGQLSLDDAHPVDLVDAFHRAGFRGLGEITSPLKNYDDRSYWPSYSRAANYGMILLFHTGIVNRPNPSVAADISVDRMRPTTLDGIARRFPDVTIIGAHLGNPDYAWAAEIARWNPNLYFDLSGSSLIKTQQNYTIFKSVFWWTGIESPHTPKSGSNAFEKFGFGSDVFNGELDEFDRELERYHKMLDACGVPEQSQSKIFAGTLWSILNSQSTLKR